MRKGFAKTIISVNAIMRIVMRSVNGTVCTISVHVNRFFCARKCIIGRIIVKYWEIKHGIVLTMPQSSEKGIVSTMLPIVNSGVRMHSTAAALGLFPKDATFREHQHSVLAKESHTKRVI
jgi:hypothetical protein